MTAWAATMSTSGEAGQGDLAKSFMQMLQKKEEEIARYKARHASCVRRPAFRTHLARRPLRRSVARLTPVAPCV